MQSLSRRSLMRLAGGAGGAVGLVGANVLPAAASPGVSIRLDRAVADLGLGQTLTLRTSVDPAQVRALQVVDTTGLQWTPVASERVGVQAWTAVPRQPGPGHVVAVSTRSDGQQGYDGLDFEVVGTPAFAPAAGALIGMSAPAGEWDAKVAQVGAGLGARRIFADLAGGALDQIRLVEEAHTAGLLPVISYKVGHDVAGAISGRFDAAAEGAAAKLDSYGLATAVTIFHEPYANMSGAEYTAMHKRLLPVFKRGELRVGPILNGWLLDNKVAEFASFCPDELFELWDYFGIDTYESGTMADPGDVGPGDRIRAASAYLKSRGYDLPLGVGEYNGYSVEAIADAGEALLSTPNVWFGCLWNSTGGVGVELDGARLAAFRATLADPRAGGGAR